MNRLTKEQFGNLLDHCRNPLVQDMLRVEYGAGMRLGELVSLRRSNVDFDGKALVVRTPCSDRRVPIDDETLGVLKRVLDSHPFDFVFCRKDGMPLSASFVLHLLKAAARFAGLEVRFSNLRLNCALRLCDGEMPAEETAARMGWSTEGFLESLTRTSLRSAEMAALRGGKVPHCD